MIEPLEGMPPAIVGLRAAGKVTAEDYEQVLAPAWSTRWPTVARSGSHFTNFARVALITDVNWIRHAVNTLGFLMPGEIKVLQLAAREAAAWAVGSG